MIVSMVCVYFRTCDDGDHHHHYESLFAFGGWHNTLVEIEALRFATCSLTVRLTQGQR